MHAYHSRVSFPYITMHASSGLYDNVLFSDPYELWKAYIDFARIYHCANSLLYDTVYIGLYLKYTLDLYI